MPIADYQQRLREMVTDQDANIAADVRDRALADAIVRYDADLPRTVLVAGTPTSAPHVVDADTDTIPPEHRQPVAQYAAYLLCQQLATRYSGERETAVGGEMARTESRAKAYAARAQEYRSAYFAGTGQSDPYRQAERGDDLAPAASVGRWPGRRRYNLTRGAW